MLLVCVLSVVCIHDVVCIAKYVRYSQLSLKVHIIVIILSPVFDGILL